MRETNEDKFDQRKRKPANEVMVISTTIMQVQEEQGH